MRSSRHQVDTNVYPERHLIAAPEARQLSKQFIDQLISNYKSQNSARQKLASGLGRLLKRDTAGTSNGVAALIRLNKHLGAKQLSVKNVAILANILLNRDIDHKAEWTNGKWDPTKNTNQVFWQLQHAVYEWVEKNMGEVLGATERDDTIALFDRKGNPAVDESERAITMTASQLIKKAVRRTVKITTRQFIQDMLSEAKNTGGKTLEILDELLSAKHASRDTPISETTHGRIRQMRDATATRKLQYYQALYRGRPVDLSLLDSTALRMIEQYCQLNPNRLTAALQTHARINHSTNLLRSGARELDNAMDLYRPRRKDVRTRYHQKSTAGLAGAKLVSIVSKGTGSKQHFAEAKVADAQRAREILTTEEVALNGIPTSIGAIVEPSTADKQAISLLGEVCFARFLILERECLAITQAYPSFRDSTTHASDGGDANVALELRELRIEAVQYLMKAGRAMNSRALQVLAARAEHGCGTLSMPQMPTLSEYYQGLGDMRQSAERAMLQAWRVDANIHARTQPLLLPGSAQKLNGTPDASPRGDRQAPRAAALEADGEGVAVETSREASTPGLDG